jgi:hypothetical protein
MESHLNIEIRNVEGGPVTGKISLINSPIAVERAIGRG